MSNVYQLRAPVPMIETAPISTYGDSNQGWIKDHRKSLDSVIAKCCIKSHIWGYLLKKATHKTYTTRYGKERITLSPGQLITSKSKLLERFSDSPVKVTIDHIRGAMDFLQKEGMITAEGSRKGSIISIVNWGEYQSEKQGKNQEKTGDFSPQHIPNANPQHENIRSFNEYEAFRTGKPNAFPNQSPTELPTIQEDNNINNKNTCQIANANDRCNDENLTLKQPSSASTDQPKKPVKNPDTPFKKIAEIYNDVIGDDFPKCRSMDARKRKAVIRNFWKAMSFNLEYVESYFTDFSENAKPWYRGHNDRGWVADIEYICRDTTIIKMREAN